MSEAIDYTARELLRDGSQIEIRALRREDEADMLAAIGKTSAQSLQRRFFVMKRHFSDKERAFFMDIDFKNHVAIVALAEEAGRKVIVGGGRYIVFEPGRAEMAFVVIDAWQGRGIGSILMRHLVKFASDAGLQELTAEVLPENAAMIKVFGKFGFKPAAQRDPQTTPSGTEARLEALRGDVPARFRSGDVAEDAAPVFRPAPPFGLPHSQGRAPIAAIPGLIPAYEAAGISRRVAPLAFHVIAPFLKSSQTIVSPGQWRCAWDS